MWLLRLRMSPAGTCKWIGMITEILARGYKRQMYCSSFLSLRTVALFDEWSFDILIHKGALLLFVGEEEEDGIERTCDTLLMCIVTVLNQGLRNGGGVGDVLRKPSKDVSVLAEEMHYSLCISWMPKSILEVIDSIFIWPALMSHSWFIHVIFTSHMEYLMGRAKLVVIMLLEERNSRQ